MVPEECANISGDMCGGHVVPFGRMQRAHLRARRVPMNPGGRNGVASLPLNSRDTIPLQETLSGLKYELRSFQSDL
jgi:hypothetical protein